MNPKDAVELVDHASAMSDRWLFLAMLVLVLGGGVIIIKYLVNQNDNQRTAHGAVMEKLIIVLYDATQVMKDVKELLENAGKHSKVLFLLACVWILAGCAQTVVYRNGQPILKTQANAKSLVFRQGDTYLRIDGLNHSTPTRAGGSVAGTIGTSIVSGITAAAAL